MDNALRPALVSYSDIEGGAARASYRLHQSLRAAGVESELHVRKQIGTDPTTISVPSGSVGFGASQVRRAIEKRLAKVQRTDDFSMRSPNILPTWWARELNRSQADLINVHWVGAGAMSIADLARIRLPTVITCHDMWTFCGSEHYASDEPGSRWRVGYSRDNRPPSDRGLDLDRITWERKRRLWQPMSIVAPSQWLADCARSSALTGAWPITVVPNPLDTNTFRPVERRLAREKLGLPRDAQIALFGAIGGPTDPRKGFTFLAEALNAMSSDNHKLLTMVFGQDAPGHSQALRLPTRWLGHIDSDEKLALAYSAADVTIVPSLQENLPQIGTESQACGTPVVAFDTAGLQDVVEHERTGYLADPFSTHDLAQGIGWVLEDASRAKSLGANARRRAVELWSPDVVVRQYASVYAEAVELARDRNHGLG